MISDAIERCSECVLARCFSGSCPLSALQLRPDRVLCAAGEVPPRALFVKEGLIGLKSLSPEGTVRHLRIRGPGTLVCCEALQQQCSPVEVVTLTEARLCVVTPGQLREQLGPPDGPGWALVQMLLGELGRREQEAECARGAALGRVARYLLAYLPEDGRALGVKKLHLAQALGMCPETLSRCLNRLELRGAIAPGPGLRLLDRPGLRAVAATHVN